MLSLTKLAVKKAPIRGAFFVCLMFLYGCANSNGDSELYPVKKVIDGDTLVLKNGETIRFVGINTPELGHGRFRDEPFAKTAKQFVERQIGRNSVRIEFGEEKKDRHGRLLGHVFSAKGENIQIQALELGLGFVVAVGNQLNFLPDYLEAEQRAREAGKGVWGDRFYAPISARKAESGKARGYRLVKGTVQRVSTSRNNETLHLEDDFRVLIRRENWKTYFKGRPSRFVGETVIARGWLFKSHDVTGMKVYHPSMVETQ